MFTWNSSRPKINHKLLYNNFENGELKRIDVSSKIISLQCFWLQKLCYENFHKWEFHNSFSSYKQILQKIL